MKFNTPEMNARRSAFEKWARAQGMSVGRDEAGYYDDDEAGKLAWKRWRTDNPLATDAAPPSAPAPLPEPAPASGAVGCLPLEPDEKMLEAPDAGSFVPASIQDAERRHANYRFIYTAMVNDFIRRQKGTK
jgi:hypothetical protein